MSVKDQIEEDYAKRNEATSFHEARSLELKPRLVNL